MESPAARARTRQIKRRAGTGLQKGACAKDAGSGLVLGAIDLSRHSRWGCGGCWGCWCPWHGPTEGPSTQTRTPTSSTLAGCSVATPAPRTLRKSSPWVSVHCSKSFILQLYIVTESQKKFVCHPKLCNLTLFLSFCVPLFDLLACVWKLGRVLRIGVVQVADVIISRRFYLCTLQLLATHASAKTTLAHSIALRCMLHNISLPNYRTYVLQNYAQHKYYIISCFKNSW